MRSFRITNQRSRRVLVHQRANNIISIKVSSRVNTSLVTQGTLLLSCAEYYCLKSLDYVHNGKYSVRRRVEGENLHIEKFVRKGDITQEKGSVVLRVDEFKKLSDLDLEFTAFAP